MAACAVAAVAKARMMGWGRPTHRTEDLYGGLPDDGLAALPASALAE
ncbi:hypothetical protein [Actinomadura sp. DC4]|nr:hypothetical protein [Actinomadura sp. DC4]MDN3354663.1 hypothetical protein [Actinomadura sp. DC4]